MSKYKSLHFLKEINTYNPKEKNKFILFGSALSILVFIAITTLFPFKDLINNLLYPKPSSHAALSQIKTQGSQFVDESGSVQFLRGFVTITNNASGSGMPNVTYTLQDYQRMKSLGANVQSIRIGLGGLGYKNNGVPSPGYIQKLQNMVALAEQAGIYTNFKLTTYDVSDFSGATADQSWTDLWNNTNNNQDQLISSWQNVWTTFKDDPGVIGYDLLNEPKIGNINATDDQFIANYLNPFYQKVIDSLRQTDSKHLVFFQPPFAKTGFNYLSYTSNISRPQTVFTAHFYPNFGGFLINNDFSTNSYSNVLAQFLNNASTNGVPLFIGEYGMPWNPINDGNTSLENQFQTTEIAATNLLVQHNLSFTRPWYADDNSSSILPINGTNYTVDWSIIKGTGGLSGSFRTFITDVFSNSVAATITPTPNISSTPGAITNGVDIHLSYSDDGGVTWNYQGPLWPSYRDTDKGGANEPGATSFEVSNILPVVNNGQTTWLGARWAYFVPDSGSYNAVPTSSRRLLISQASSPQGLATADSATLAAASTSSAWGIDTNLASLAPAVANCSWLSEPALYYESNTLYLTVACSGGGIKLVVFSTQPQGDIHTWQWHYLGTLAGTAEANELGGDGLTQVDIAKGKDGTLLAIMSPASTGTGPANVLNHIGCKVVEVQSLNPPLFARDTAGNLKVRAFITASDLAPIGPGACTYDPYSSTGLIITRRVNETTTFNADLHQTGIKVDSSAPTQTFDCPPNSTNCPQIVINGDPFSTFPNGSLTPFYGSADPSIRKDPNSNRLWMSYSWPHSNLINSTPSPTITPIQGDINGDRIINLIDLSALLSNLNKPLTNTNVPCDLDNNGVINSADFAKLVNILITNSII